MNLPQISFQNRFNGADEQNQRRTSADGRSSAFQNAEIHVEVVKIYQKLPLTA